MENESLEGVRRMVHGAHNKMPFAQRLNHSIIGASTIPGAHKLMGILKSKSTPRAFWIQSTCLSTLFGIKANSLRKNLRDLGLHRLPVSNPAIDTPTDHLVLGSEISHWSLWQNEIGEFNESMTLSDLEIFTAHARAARRGLAHTPAQPPFVDNPWDDFLNNPFD
jgi:hypothetical protein